MSARINERKVYIDFIKIIAILMVLFNHTGDAGFSLFIEKRGSFLLFLYLFISIFIKAAVPLFFMSSGALLLGKDESIGVILKKRVARYTAILVFASVITYTYKVFIKGQYAFNIRGLITDIFTGNVAVAYWYLYAYIAFLCTLPFLRVLANNMNHRHYTWLLLLYGIFQFMIIMEWLIWKGSAVHNSSFSLVTVKEYVFYPLIGYYIDKILPPSSFSKNNMIIVLLISAFSIIVTCLLTVYYCQQTNGLNGNGWEYFFSSLIFLPSIAVFYMAKYWFQKFTLSDRKNQALALIGNATFGIYLFEYIYRTVSRPIYNTLSLFIPKMLACWVWVLSAAAIGFFMTSILKRIPFVRKLL